MTAASNVGQTLLAGHALFAEGKAHYGADGRHAQCSCGQLSPAGQSQAANKRWHREHKAAIRAAAEAAS